MKATDRILNSLKIKLAMTTLLSLQLASLANAAPPKAFAFAPDAGTTTFQAVGRPSAIKINGKGKGADGELTLKGDVVSGTLSFDLTTLTTEIDMRDHHMKEKYLEVDKFPKAKLTIKELKVPADIINKTDAKVAGVPFTGTLNLHGQDKPVSGTCDLERSGASVQANANFNIKLTDYKIDIPKYLGITVAEDVSVGTKSKISVK